MLFKGVIIVAGITLIAITIAVLFM